MSSQDSLKAKYENRLMEVEDSLTCEISKCAEVIKARVAPLNEKIEFLKKNEDKLKREEKDLLGKIREMTG